MAIPQVPQTNHIVCHTFHSLYTDAVDYYIYALRRYRGKKHWDTFAVIEGEPVEAFVQVGLMGSLASELVAAGLQPVSYTHLKTSRAMNTA